MHVSTCVLSISFLVNRVFQQDIIVSYISWLRSKGVREECRKIIMRKNIHIARKYSYIHIICFHLESIWVTLFSERNPHINQCTSPKIYFSDYNAFPHKIWINRRRYDPQFTFDFVLWPRKMYLKVIFMDIRPVFSKLDVQFRSKNYLLCSIINFLNTNLASSAMSFPIPSNID